MPATIKSVAQYAGVSIKTVSRVINNEGTVKPATLEKVQEAIEALDYKPNKAARDLAGRENFVLGYVYDNPNAYYIIDMQKGILDECRSSGYELLIHPCNAASDNIVNELVNMVSSARLAGLILSPPLSEMPQVLSALDERNICYVRILSGSTTPNSSLPSVLIDDYKAAYAITEHLIEQGHSRIAFISGDMAHQSTIERQEGYKAALKARDIPVDNQLILNGTYSFETGVKSAEKIVKMAPTPTAVFACNDEIAAGTLFGARMNGLDVPAQLAIAGFEDSPFSRQTYPTLTTAAQPTTEIAKSATSALIQCIRSRKKAGNQDAIRSRFFTPQLVIRQSTKG
ncbi:LacI family DNA-binding transcriptional regulator [Aestuariibacter sp. AA17]|uniref:LacI family DNA-binding transcriptional regulator n=1 Tax=Fluctibacter corallii TaxID=2984329 RepID=A0ABT3A542_9ALTE|nr:LacI family DNA-binding transcriptional regulator [Aestuariibacter sp. AA17]MCV2883759.1 LacI family DNA-binding transcriptional regulator [Aestuariibacter sp. AA17]